jgi:hypothetical protein
MDTAHIIAICAICVPTVLTIVGGCIYVAWSVRGEISQGNARVHMRMDEQGDKFTEAVDELEIVIRNESRDNRDRIEAIGQRVTKVETKLDQHLVTHPKDQS